MNFLKRLFGGDTRQFGMIAALIALLLFFQVKTGGKMLMAVNVINILQGNSYVLILAIGMVLVIIAGHIDLSVGSVAAAVGIVVAMAMKDHDLAWPLAILLGLLMGAVIGAWQGFWVAYVGIPAFIVTLAGMLIFRGVNQALGKSLSIPVPEAFQEIGAGYVPNFGPNTHYSNPTLLIGLAACAFIVLAAVRKRANQRRIDAVMEPAAVTWTRIVLVCAVILAVTLLLASGPVGTSIPVSTIILGALVLLYGFISTRTVFGRHVYAVGGNKHAAELSGVKSKRVDFLVMMNMSILAALAGMVFIARSTASGPFDGTGWELDAIAAVFIGGAAVSGGVGTVVGAMIGGLVMAVLNNGLQLTGAGADATAITKGLVLLAAVAFDVFNKSQGRASIIGRLTSSRSNAPAAPEPTTVQPPVDPTHNA